MLEARQEVREDGHEVNLAKHRNGETGMFKLAGIGGYTKFENLVAAVGPGGTLQIRID
jgi:replicative DNA helicase